jgi:hypothetical protein
MRRLTSLLFRSSATASMLAVLVLTPASAFAQRTPSPAAAPQNVVQPMFPTVDAPTPSMNAIQATTPPATAPAAAQNAPRAETLRAPSIAMPGSGPMPPATNIRLELTITDTLTGVPVKKTVSLMVLTNNSGMIRTTSSDGTSVLNVDALASAYTGGVVSLRMTFEYRPPQVSKDTGRPPYLNESLTVALQDGKAMVVSQSADPATDRKVTAELTATILK